MAWILLIIFSNDIPAVTIEFNNKASCYAAAEQVSQTLYFQTGAFGKSRPAPVAYCLENSL